MKYESQRLSIKLCNYFIDFLHIIHETRNYCRYEGNMRSRTYKSYDSLILLCLKLFEEKVLCIP